MIRSFRHDACRNPPDFPVNVSPRGMHASAAPPARPSKAAQISQQNRPPSSHHLCRTLLVVMSELLLHIRSRHPSFRGNTVPFPRAPSISRQSLSLTQTDIESIGYSYSQAYDNLSHDPRRLTKHGFPAPLQGRPVVEENEERRRSRGSRSPASSPLTHRSSIPPSLGQPLATEIFPEDITVAIMSLLPRVEARTAAIAKSRSKRSKRLRVRAYKPAKQLAKAAGRAISTVTKAIPTFCLKHRY
ncbi:hypothetical protein BGW80DRAFT_1458349 [Lactifluus volemus]|nr:hypothetical protein BGW80DRAFT_1458349 [Lactifluus volemus]